MIARRAGITVATSATAARISATALKVTASVVLTPNSKPAITRVSASAAITSESLNDAGARTCREICQRRDNCCGVSRALRAAWIFDAEAANRCCFSSSVGPGESVRAVSQVVPLVIEAETSVDLVL